ncbi:MAG: radical SAM family heme chaperone HemW [Steroidobacteraceae bacterium]
MRPPLALYVHMPWCVRKCPYCDFNSHPLKGSRPDAGYIDALLADAAREAPLVEGRRIETIFFGGGTPSLFTPADFQRLLQGLRAFIDIAADAEITMEANPGAVERGAFAGYAAAGINRVSLGAQSFSAAALQRLGRIHAPEDTDRAVSELRAAGLRNFNLDLMYALPEQRVEEALADLRHALQLGPSHLSHYQLTLEPGTAFAARPPTLPAEDESFAMQCESLSLLAGAGFEQYEVSAHARGGARCRHNLNYWRFGDYLGIGAGAHGKLTLEDRASGETHILRTAKPRQPREYLREALAMGEGSDQPFGERRVVPSPELPFEFMLNVLRLPAGFSEAEFESGTGLPVERITAPLARAEARGLLRRVGQGWQPTTLGMRFLNDLQAEFLS